MLDKLKQEVLEANLELNRRGLVIYTWGNVSGIDREQNLVVIKPSGVDYSKLTAEMLVVVDLDGKVVSGDLRPSSDLPTHLELYNSFPEIGGVAHTHSTYATAWAQAKIDLPCLGTTHADHFYGGIPCTRPLSEREVARDYEINTGKVIAQHFSKYNENQMPAVLVAEHGPFTWGTDAHDAVVNSVVLEEVARMATLTFNIGSNRSGISQYLLDKHYLRKHGKNAYYGQE